MLMSFWQLLVVTSSRKAAVRYKLAFDNPFYTLRRTGKTDWQGMIVETGTEHRRALSLTSLNDLLNS